MKLIRLTLALALVGVPAFLTGCASDPDKSWGSEDPLDRFEQPKGDSQIHGEMGVNSSWGR